MARNETRKSPARARVVRALVQHGTVTGAARAVGCSRSTIYRWLKDEEFCDQLEESRERAADAEIDGLIDLRRRQVQAARLGLEVLEAALESDDTPLPVRVRVASYFLDAAGSAAERLEAWSAGRRDSLPAFSKVSTRPPASRAECQANRLVE
ncbi:MAG: helix-turn-helix domain-containing protein [bacterium]|nr:helix-turn-helix domain-containing protein [bacterium]